MRCNMVYNIRETHCYPNNWKIEAVGYRDDNDSSNYFPSQDAALDEIIRRNADIKDVITLDLLRKLHQRG